MKIVKSRSMGGSGKTSMQRALDAEPAANRKTGKCGVQTRGAGINRDRALPLDEISSALSIALLELAFDRYLAVDGDPADAFDMIETVFRRVVRKRQGTRR